MTESLAALLSAVIFLFFSIFSAIVAGVRNRILTDKYSKTNKRYDGMDPLVIFFGIFSIICLVLTLGNLIASVWKAV